MCTTARLQRVHSSELLILFPRLLLIKFLKNTFFPKYFRFVVSKFVYKMNQETRKEVLTEGYLKWGFLKIIVVNLVKCKPPKHERNMLLSKLML